MAVMPRLLVTGAAGFLGWHVCLNARRNWMVTGTVHRHVPSPPDGVRFSDTDLLTPGAAEALIERFRPDAVMHCAALASPNACEQSPTAAHLINVRATLWLAAACARRDIRFGFTSTDLVFDGEHAPYSEADAPAPLSEYGRQKVEAEQGILLRHPRAVICRMPLMFGLGGPGATNCLSDFLRRARETDEIRLFVDEFRTPVDADSAATGCLAALKDLSGIVHLGGPDRLSRYDLGVAMAEAFGVDIDRLTRTSQQDVAMPAPRARDVSLESVRAAALGFTPPTPRQALEDLARVASGSGLSRFRDLPSA